MITRRCLLCLGASQLICWGVSFYLIGVFGERIAADLGWSRALVYGGFSVALLVMGLVSPLAGRLIDRAGGGPVMAAGSLITALACTGLAFAETLIPYYAAWMALGLAMRLTLYDAAFAALVRIGGAAAGRPIALITLLGGLASTCFWPLGHVLAESLGWRGALLVYAGLALLTLPLHLALPGDRHPAAGTAEQEPTAPGQGLTLSALLYALMVMLINGLNAGFSAHMIAVLTELGLAASLAVSASSLRGLGQSAARLAEVLFGGRLHPVDLNLAASLVLPVCFTIGLASGGFVVAALAFAFFYGAGNGILSITRGTLPLVLFDPRGYGAFVGRLLVPSFFLSAASPLAFAFVIERFGAGAALYLAIGLSSVALLAAVVLRILAAPGISGQRQAGGRV